MTIRAQFEQYTNVVYLRTYSVHKAQSFHEILTNEKLRVRVLTGTYRETPYCVQNPAKFNLNSRINKAPAWIKRTGKIERLCYIVVLKS